MEGLLVCEFYGIFEVFECYCYCYEVNNVYCDCLLEVGLVFFGFNFELDFVEYVELLCDVYLYYIVM